MTAELLTPSSVAELALVRDLVRSGAARRIRLRGHLSLAEVARSVGVTVATLQHWEAAQNLPKGSKALRYLQTLELIDAAAPEVLG